MARYSTELNVIQKKLLTFAKVEENKMRKVIHCDLSYTKPWHQPCRLQVLTYTYTTLADDEIKRSWLVTNDDKAVYYSLSYVKYADTRTRTIDLMNLLTGYILFY